MPVMQCGEEKCEQPISVSVAPEGNPIARELGMCVAYVCCEQCGRFWCDECAASGSACPECGQARTGPSPPHALMVMMGHWRADVLATVSLTRSDS